ncbi:hypothetical protein PS2_037390 [Malus domestica]
MQKLQQLACHSFDACVSALFGEKMMPEAESSEAARLCTTTIRRRNWQSCSDPSICSAWEPVSFPGSSSSCFRDPELGAWDSASVAAEPTSFWGFLRHT